MAPEEANAFAIACCRQQIRSEHGGRGIVMKRFEQAIRQSRLTVVNVRNDTEIANVGRIHYLLSSSRIGAGFRFGMGGLLLPEYDSWDVERV